MPIVLALNRKYAKLLRKAIEADIPINTDPEGCPPCGTLPEWDTCFGCPYRLVDNGLTWKEVDHVLPKEEE